MTAALPLKPAPRGLAHFENATPQVLAGIVLMAALSAYIAWQQIWLFRNWADLFAGLGRWFALDVAVVVSSTQALAVSVSAPSHTPSMATSVAGALAGALVLWVLSSVLNARHVPARYLLRAMALVLGLPAAGYWMLGLMPQLDVAAHVAQVFKVGYWFLLVIPVLFALTGFVLPGNVAKKTLWTLLALLYFFTSTPVLALVHLQVLLLAGAAWAPALNVLALVLLMSVHLVSFYSLVASCEA